MKKLIQESKFDLNKEDVEKISEMLDEAKEIAIDKFFPGLRAMH